MAMNDVDIMPGREFRDDTRGVYVRPAEMPTHRYPGDTQGKRFREFREGALCPFCPSGRVSDDADCVTSLRLRGCQVDDVPEQAADRRTQDVENAKRLHSCAGRSWFRTSVPRR